MNGYAISTFLACFLGGRKLIIRGHNALSTLLDAVIIAVNEPFEVQNWESHHGSASCGGPFTALRVPLKRLAGWGGLQYLLESSTNRAEAVYQITFSEARGFAVWKKPDRESQR